MKSRTLKYGDIIYLVYHTKSGKKRIVTGDGLANPLV